MSENDSHSKQNSSNVTNEIPDGYKRLFDALKDEDGRVYFIPRDRQVTVSSKDLQNALLHLTEMAEELASLKMGIDPHDLNSDLFKSLKKFKEWK